MSTLVWLRGDLRLSDQPALQFAIERGQPVLPVFVLEPATLWSPGAASRVWLHDSLAALATALEARGARLLLRVGAPEIVLAELATATGASALSFNARVEPAGRAADARVARALAAQLTVRVCNGSLLLDPADIATGGGTPYRVFTPFWRQAHSLLSAARAPVASLPARLLAPAVWPTSPALETLGLLPQVRWDLALRAQWPASEAAAHAALASFLDAAVEDYPTGRDLPGREGVSRLSPYLHLGQLSPYQVWHEVHARAASDGRLAPNAAALAWLRQLVWREFAQHLLWHFPATAQAPLRPEFNHFPWCEDVPGFQRWCRGETGFPIVDAGMRQLWQTGWMHNRVRMIVASFLTKDLGLHWLEGARWFWDTLTDANLANNTLGWQWVAGCGADAAPYFRIFNPLTQSLKFDPEGVYLRRWLPELGALSGNDLHAPWQAAPLRLQAANFKLERDYPAPMLDHAQARVAALARLKASK